MDVLTALFVWIDCGIYPTFREMIDVFGIPMGNAKEPAAKRSLI